MNDKKYDINAFSPEELREVYIKIYAEVFESSLEHAKEMFLSRYSSDHDFVIYKRVEDAIESMKKLCGVA